MLGLGDDLDTVPGSQAVAFTLIGGDIVAIAEDHHRLNRLAAELLERGLRFDELDDLADLLKSVAKVFAL